MDADLVSERAAVRASITGDCGWIAAIDDPISPSGVANQKGRNRHVDLADLKRAAAEQEAADGRQLRSYAGAVKVARIPKARLRPNAKRRYLGLFFDDVWLDHDRIVVSLRTATRASRST